MPTDRSSSSSPPPSNPPKMPRLPADTGLPPMVRFLGLHLGVGIAVGVAAASLMVLSNTGGLKDLLIGDSNPLVALAALYISLALTGGSVAMGIAVMTLPWDGPGPDDEEAERRRQRDDRPAS